MQQFAILPRQDGILFEDADVAVQCFSGGRKRTLQPIGSLFYAVVSGRPVVNGLVILPGMYGCLPETATFEGDDLCRVLIIDAKGWHGIFALGGPIEPQGRLRYINGCTDTGLLQPIRLGDPCLNALFFLPHIVQTPHRHPSHRIGAVFDGEGLCMTGHDGTPTPMNRGDLFIIPAQSLHWFETGGSPMRIIAFHPDSEVGPTDERHQMLEATLI